MFKKTILPIVLATIWISLSEVFRNTFLLHNLWIEHYQKMGLTFPEQPINGAVWGTWSLVFACVIYIVSQKFNFLQTFLLCWVIGFVMMWLVIGNLGVLPFGLLIYAIPLSLLETIVALFIIKQLNK